MSTVSAQTEQATSRQGRVEIASPRLFVADYVGFSGHRNCIVPKEYFPQILALFPTAGWIHGGAGSGFDAQVHEFLKERGDGEESWREQVIRPDPQVQKQTFKGAYIARDFEIVDASNFMVFCYDGRRFGGTYETLKYCKRKNKPRLMLPYIRIDQAFKKFQDGE